MRQVVRSALVIAAAAALAVAWQALAAEEPEQKPPDPGKPDAEPAKVRKAFAFTLEDQNGKKVSFSTFRKKIVVLEWLDPDSPECLRHYKAGTYKAVLDKLKGKNKQRVVWLAINSDVYGTAETNKKFAQEYKVQYQILDDCAGRVGKIYGIKVTPTILIKAPDGSIAYSGAVDDDPKGEKEEPLNYVAQALDELIEGKAISVAETEPYGTAIPYNRRR